MDFIAPCRSIKSTLRPASGKIVYCATRGKNIFCECEVWCPSKARVTTIRLKLMFSPSRTRFFSTTGSKNELFILGGYKVDFIAPCRAIKSTWRPASRKIVYFATRGKKYILQVRSLMPEQSEGNNHTIKINVFSVSHTIFFY